jgi:hypothetical protein
MNACLEALFGGLSSLPHWSMPVRLLPFHSNKNLKKYRVQLIGVFFLKIIYANWVSIIEY